VFLNLSFHPMILTQYTGLWNGTFQRSNVVLGQKPQEGFTDERMLMWYWCPSWESTHPFYMMKNEANPHWNMSLYNNEFCIGHDANYSIRAANFLEFGVAPVYTIIVTGQTINPEDGTVHTQSKLQATVERTWDGKLNILEYQLTPGLFEKSY
jgi:hypothetical protein